MVSRKFLISVFRKKFDTLPGDFRSWESPQTLPALFIGPFEHVERFRNLKLAVIRITDIQSTVLSSSEGITATRGDNSHRLGYGMCHFLRVLFWLKNKFLGLFYSL